MPTHAQREQCARAMPRGWAYAPWECAWKLVPLEQRVRAFTTPTWLLIAGNSQVRGRWNAAMTELLSVDIMLLDHLLGHVLHDLLIDVSSKSLPVAPT